MNFVQPIRDPKIVEEIKRYLKVRSLRNFLFFALGVHGGLRVSDLLQLQVRHVKGTHIKLREGKTGKTNMFKIHPSLRDDIDAYIAGKHEDEYLFASRQEKTKTKSKAEPINRSTAYKMLRQVAQHFGLTDIGTHTMRKTFGYRLYMEDPRTLALLMKMFNHSDERITLMYLGLTQDVMDAAVERLSYS